MIDWSQSAVLLVLLAAAMHALWNSLLKTNGERSVMLVLLTGGAALGGAAAAVFLPPPGSAAAPYLLLSTLVHSAYLWGVSQAYHHSPLSLAYPIARGGAPLLVMLVSVLLLGESLSASQVAGISVLGLGVMSLALGPLLLNRDWRGPAWALFTACCIAGYSLADGRGARAASNPHSYAAWLFMAQFLPVAAFGLYRYGRALPAQLRQHAVVGVAGGLLSLASYWIVIWAMTVISVPVATALRESSVIFAMLIGVLWLKEPWSYVRAAATALVLFGVVLLRL